MSTYKVQFEQKSISAIQTVAELLRFARTEQGREIEEVALELQISPMYIESLEAGAYERLPSLVYARNFVKKYGGALGLNLPPLLELFTQEWELFKKHQQSLLDVPQQTGIDKTNMWRMPRWIRWGSATLVVLFIFTYLGFELYTLGQPPMLVVHTPQEEVVTDKQIIKVSGKTEPEVALSINDQTILSDAEGNFEEIIALQPGLNVVEIEAKKKYSRENKIYRRIIVSEKPVITNIDDSELPIS